MRLLKRAGLFLLGLVPRLDDWGDGTESRYTHFAYRYNLKLYDIKQRLER